MRGEDNPPHQGGLRERNPVRRQAVRVPQEDPNPTSVQIVIYETAPISRVVGTVDVCGVLEGDPGELYDRTSYGAGISREDYDEYFKGAKKAYAFELGVPSMFYCCPSVERYGLKGAPQSFAYVKEEGK